MWINGCVRVCTVARVTVENKGQSDLLLEDSPAGGQTRT